MASLNKLNPSVSRAYIEEHYFVNLQIVFNMILFRYDLPPAIIPL